MDNKTLNNETLTVEETAKLLKKGVQFVRIGLQNNVFPFGFAVKTSSKYTYYINKKKAVEYVGGK